MKGNYKIVKSDHRYFFVYKAVLYKRINVFKWGFWLSMETVKGKDWLVNGAIEEWQDRYNAELIDFSTSNQ